MAAKPRYSDHLDVLLALVTYLGLSRERARTPHGMARDLGLDEDDVMTALTSFPSLYRRSHVADGTTAVGSQHMYTLHARFARRRGPSATHGDGEELDADQLGALLDFISEQARMERESRRHTVTQVWLLAGVFIAATASVISAVIQATGKA